MKQFGYAADHEHSIGPDDVAQIMVDLVTDGKWGGGTILECSPSGSRALGTWNIEPPSSKGTGVPKDITDQNHAPVLAILKRERGVNL
jgi:hypothetical protein